MRAPCGQVLAANLRIVCAAQRGDGTLERLSMLVDIGLANSEISA
jgi:hypothetical protein